MRRLRKAVLTVLVWATAASTLLANSPHFTCRCPDGKVKLYCIAAPGDGSPCCGRTCCSSEEPTSAKPRPCCQPQTGTMASPRAASDKRTDRAPAKGAGLSRTGCQKTLTTPEACSPIRPGVQTAEMCVADADLPCVAGELQVIAPAMAFQAPYQLPPPTDLVTALQRLTI